MFLDLPSNSERALPGTTNLAFAAAWCNHTSSVGHCW